MAFLNLQGVGIQVWTGTFKPYEIKTLTVDAKTGKVAEANALEE